MSREVRKTTLNNLLDSLPSRMSNSLRNKCERVELKYGDILCEPGEVIRSVYFPIESFISLVATVADGASLEVGLIGSEGMLGIPLVLGVANSPLRALVQGSGGAWRMPVAAFRNSLEHDRALRVELDRYVYVLIAQLAQAAACTCFHILDARLARWLLMAHDRAHADHFYLTHALLAQMLGVRRSGVSTAAGVLQRNKLIHYRRGNIIILDRHGLEQASCDCYRVMTDAYQWLNGGSSSDKAAIAVKPAARRRNKSTIPLPATLELPSTTDFRRPAQTSFGKSPATG